MTYEILSMSSLVIISIGSISTLLLFLFMYIEGYRAAAKLPPKYRNFMMPILRSAVLIDAIGVVYYYLRIQQWMLGFYQYIFVDFAVMIITISLYLMTYPFFVDKLKEIKNIYG